MEVGPGPEVGGWGGGHRLGGRQHEEDAAAISNTSYGLGITQ